MARRTQKAADRAALLGWELLCKGASNPEIAAAINPDTGRPLYASAGAAGEAMRKMARIAADLDDLETLRAASLTRLNRSLLDLNRTLQSAGPADWRARTAVHRAILQVDQRIALLMGLDAEAEWALPAAPPADRAEAIARLQARVRGVRLQLVETQDGGLVELETGVEVREA